MIFCYSYFTRGEREYPYFIVQYYKIGDEITIPPETKLTDVTPETHKVTDIQILDSLPLDQYPKENYIENYDTVVAPLLNEDGTLKDHERYPLKNGTIVEDGIEYGILVLPCFRSVSGICLGPPYAGISDRADVNRQSEKRRMFR